MTDRDLIIALLDDDEAPSESRSDYEGNLRPAWLCLGCGYGLPADHAGRCPKCGDGARELAPAFMPPPDHSQLHKADTINHAAVAAGKISGRASAEKRSQAMNKKYNGQKGKP